MARSCINEVWLSFNQLILWRCNRYLMFFRLTLLNHIIKYELSVPRQNCFHRIQIINRSQCMCNGLVGLKEMVQICGRVLSTDGSL